MDAKHSQQKRCLPYLRAKLFTLLLSLLVFASLAASQGSDGGIRVKVHTRQRTGTEKPVSLGNVTVKIGPASVTTDGAGEASTIVPRGTHNVKAYLQGFIVTDMSIYPDAMGGTHGGGDAKSDEGDLDLPFLFNSSYEEEKFDSTLGIYLKPSGEPQKSALEAKRFYIVVRTWACKDPNYNNLKIRIGNTGAEYFKVIRNDYDEMIASGVSVELKPGTYGIWASVPGQLDTVVNQVEVADTLNEYGKYNVGRGQGVDVTLDERIWESPDGGAVLRIYLHGNCPDPDFYSARVLASSSKVEVIAPGGGNPKNARVNDRIERNSTIRTGSGGSLILESKYGHLITIAEDTEVQANLIMTASGREKLEAFIKMGKIQVKRVKPERSSESESTSMNVRTPTATITDKETKYMVSYDAKTNITAIGVEEGKVEVTPINTSFKPITLAANQQVQVSDKSVSAATSYSGERGSSISPILIYAGIGVAGLVVVLILIVSIYILYRILNRKQ